MKKSKLIIVTSIIIFLTILFSNTVTAEAKTKEIKTIVYTTDYLNVRIRPSIESKRVTVLSPNSKLICVKRGKEWSKVRIDNKNYYVSSKYITSIKPKEENNNVVKNKKSVLKNAKLLGTYKITAYCPCEKCCGKWAGLNKTSSGTTPTEGRTVGCNSLPAGTKISIDGHEYIVEDTGNVKDNVIDIYRSSHEAALKQGVKYTEVYLVE